MNAFSRRGACPALSVPMATGDGLLVRLNPVASGFSPKTLIGLCESASRHGNGLVEVTARGSFQIRGLIQASSRLLAEEVDALGIAVRTGVPVETGPLAGLDPDEIADPRPLAESIRERIAHAGLSARLGPKVSVVVDGGGRFGMEAVSADVRLEAVDDGQWRVAIAGDAETAHALGVCDSDQACRLTLYALEAIAELGLEGRAREIASATRKRLRSTLPPSGLPAISPTRGEIGSCNVGDWLISPLVGEMAGRPEGGNVERILGRKPQLGLHGLSDSRIALTVAVPFGQMQAEQVIAFAKSAEKLDALDIRLAPRRTVLALCPDARSAEALQATAKSLGFVTDAADPRLSISACPGTPACASGKIPARALAVAIARDHADLFDGSVELHVSGCAKGCAHPAQAALTVVGTDLGCGLVLDGTARAKPQGISHDPLSGFARLAALWNASVRNTEALSAAFSEKKP